MYAVHHHFPEVQDDKVALLVRVRCSLWLFFECGGTLSQINIHLGFHTLHLTTGVDEGIVTHMQGCEDLSGQVGYLVT